MLIRSLCLLLLTLPAYAQDAAPTPWTDPEVLQAAVRIDMDTVQSAAFRESVTEFLQGFGSDVQRLLRKHNQTGLPRKIERKRKKRVNTMDLQMAKILREAQMPAYAVYRDLLLAKMTDAPRGPRSAKAVDLPSRNPYAQQGH